MSAQPNHDHTFSLYGHFGVLISPIFKPLPRLSAYRAYFELGVTAALFDAASFWIRLLEDSIETILPSPPDTKWIRVGLRDYSEFLGNRELIDLVGKNDTKYLADERKLLRWVAVRKAMELGFKNDERFQVAEELVIKSGLDNVTADTISGSHKDVNKELNKNPVQAAYFPTWRIRSFARSIELDLGKGQKAP